MILLMNFPLPAFSAEMPTIRADPSMINVTIKRYATAETTVTLKSTLSVEKTVIFQNDTGGTHPKVDLYGQSMTVPANSNKARSVIVEPRAIDQGSYLVTLAFYYQGDVEKKPVGNVTFYIKIYDTSKVFGWPLKAEPAFLNISVPAMMSIVREIKLTNLADIPIIGEVHAQNSLCINEPYITILGDPKINLEKNESTKIKVKIEGAVTSSSDCYSLRIVFKGSNMSVSEEEFLVELNVKTSPGIPLMVVLTIAVVIVVIIVMVLSKKRGRRPQVNTIPRPSGAPRPGR
jgi:hypothetical protein